MESKAKLFSHPIHPQLVGFPMTFYTLTFLSFVIFRYLAAEAFWFKLGYFSNFATIATGLIASIPGLVDWSLAIPAKTRAKEVGLLHLGANAVAMILFAVNGYLLWGHWNAPEVTNINLILAGLGFLAVLMAGYLGWELVGTYGVGMAPKRESEFFTSTDIIREKLPPHLTHEKPTSFDRTA